MVGALVDWGTAVVAPDTQPTPHITIDRERTERITHFCIKEPSNSVPIITVEQKDEIAQLENGTWINKNKTDIRTVACMRTCCFIYAVAARVQE
jgi:hypothetical protein